MTTHTGGTFYKTLLTSNLLTFSQTMKLVMSVTYSVKCLLRFGFFHYEPQAFVCKPRTFIHFISCCKEKQSINK
jgi:hypothetical protein